MINDDTICAIATAPGGALGIIRVSGANAIAAADRIFRPVGKDKRLLAERDAYTLAYGDIIDERGETVDEVLISIFRAPHSYTGEDSVEISCHGSSYIMQRVMQLLICSGCRAAGPGEYTQRAFLNGKMDLSEAEAVADLIASTNEASRRMAMNQMRGGFSKELAALRDKLLKLTSLMELELDFSDHEELEFADRSELSEVANGVNDAISSLVGTFRIGNAIKQGVPVAIIGETNAGKSTLLNRLVGEERAIVSDIHGTTRDVIEDTVNINGVSFRFIDTAGIRDTGDEIERIGIERTMDKISHAEIVVLLVDSTVAGKQLAELGPKVLPLCDGKDLIVAYNKCDLAPQATASDIADEFKRECPTLRSVRELSLSAKTGNGIAALRSALSSIASVDSSSVNGVIVNNVRHLSALQSAQSAIQRVIDGLSSGLPTDLVSQDLRDCLYHLGEITGKEIDTDEVLGNIFKHFCVGK